MWHREFPVKLDDFVTRMAVIAFAVGVAVLVFLGWKIVGWILVAFGIQALIFAYLLGNAPAWEIEEWSAQHE